MPLAPEHSSSSLAAVPLPASAAPGPLLLLGVIASLVIAAAAAAAVIHRRGAATRRRRLVDEATSSTTSLELKALDSRLSFSPGGAPKPDNDHHDAWALNDAAMEAAGLEQLPATAEISRPPPVETPPEVATAGGGVRDASDPKYHSRLARARSARGAGASTVGAPAVSTSAPAAEPPVSTPSPNSPLYHAYQSP